VAGCLGRVPLAIACNFANLRHIPVGLADAEDSAMDWMNLPAGWLMLAAIAFVASCSLWTGMLFCVSWLTGRARMMADGPEVGGLALSIFRRWARPLLVATFVSGFVSLAGGPAERLRAHWVYGIVAAMVALFALHTVVGSRARRVERGSVRASEGEAFRRVALVLSFGAIIALAALRTSLVP
jgi:hypothetical protein